MTDVALATWKHRGTLYADDNSTAESTVDATPRKIAALDTKGVEAGLTVDTANNQITIAAAGDYLVMASASFSGSNSKNYYVAIYKNTGSTDFEVERMLGAGGDIGVVALSGIVTCAVGDDISLYQSSSDGGSAMTVTHAQLSVVRLS